MNDRRYLAPKDAAAYLSVSLRTFYEHIRPHVTAVNVGRRVTFDKTDLDGWAEQNKQAAKVEQKPQRPAPYVPTATEAPKGKWKFEPGRRGARGEFAVSPEGRFSFDPDRKLEWDPVLQKFRRKKS